MVSPILGGKMTPPTFKTQISISVFAKSMIFDVFAWRISKNQWFSHLLLILFIRITFFQHFWSNSCSRCSHRHMCLLTLSQVPPCSNCCCHCSHSNILMKLLLQLQPQARWGTKEPPKGSKEHPRRVRKTSSGDQFYIFKLPINRKAAVTSIQYI